MTVPGFVADECCPRELVNAGRKHGLDVLYVAETAPGISDAEVLEMAVNEERVVVTTDKDFGMLVVKKGYAVTGLIFLRLSRLDRKSRAAKAAHQIWRGAKFFVGRYTTFSENKIRRRMLDAIS